MKPILFILTFLLIAAIHAQQAVQPLKVGDRVPNLAISNVSHYPRSFSHINDFKGKLLILDFWGVHCTSCIEEMPHMEALQKEFGDKIQVLLVTRDSKEMVNDLLKKSAFVREIHLPFVVADTILSKYFPYNAFGLHVWLDGNSILVQKTSGTAYSANDVRKFLDGQKIKLIQRQDDQHFNTGVPLWLEGNGRQVRRIRYYSYVAGNIPEFAQSGGLLITDSTTGKIIGYRYWNCRLATLVSTAFDENRNHIAKTIWEVNDSSLFTSPKEKELFAAWEKDHTFYYELRVPVEKADQLNAFMQQDIEKYFGIKGTIEKRKVKCLLLIRSPNSDLLLHKSKPPYASGGLDIGAMQRDSIVTIGYRYLLQFMPDMLKKYLPASFVIIDETNYHEPVALNLHLTHDYEIVRKELQKNGLDLVETERELPCLILREEGYRQPIMH